MNRPVVLLSVIFAPFVLAASACSSTQSATAPSGSPALASNAPSSPAPASSAGSPPPTRAAVPVTSTAVFDRSLTVRVTSSAAVTSKGSGVGQIAGQPAVALTLSLHSLGTRLLSLRSVKVAASYGKSATPAVSVDGPPGKIFPLAVKAGGTGTGTGTGTYVFAVSVASRSSVTVTVSYDPTRPVVVFRGSLA